MQSSSNICRFESCMKPATYGNFYGQRLYCKEHSGDCKYCLQVCMCGKGRPAYKLYSDKRQMYCKECKTSEMVHFSLNKCIIETCNQPAFFEMITEKKPHYCIHHKTDEMIRVLDRRCIESGCKSHPSFNLPNEKKAIYCSEHKKSGMINLKKETCTFEGCTTKASFNLPNEKKPVRCISHKTEDMVLIYSTKCCIEGCRKKPMYNIATEKIPRYCSSHYTENMERKTNTCQHPQCQKYPSFGLSGTLKGLFCNEHKSPTMVNVKSKQCLHPDCTHQPTYNLPTEKTGLYCSSHSLPNMVDVVNPKCKLCTKIPHFNFPDKKRAEYCFSHKSPAMIDVAHKRCHVCKYMRANLNYRDNDKNPYCVRCFANTFPDIPKIRKYLCKEKFITNYVKEQFPDWTWITNTIIPDGCSLRRPDMLVDFGSHVMIIEIDEHQHDSYEEICENKRSMQLFLDCGSRPMVMIRFNPDQYTDLENHRHGSCFSFNVKGEMKTTREWQSRSQILIQQIQQLYQEYSRDFNYYELFFNPK